MARSVGVAISASPLQFSWTIRMRWGSDIGTQYRAARGKGRGARKSGIGDRVSGIGKMPILNYPPRTPKPETRIPICMLAPSPLNDYHVPLPHSEISMHIARHRAAAGSLAVVV